jgi:hypothetical protein
MKDFTLRFSAAIGAFAFGVAGFVSTYNGSLITTALTRAAVAGVVGVILGRALAVIIFDGPTVTPSAAYGKKKGGKE